MAGYEKYERKIDGIKRSRSGIEREGDNIIKSFFYIDCENPSQALRMPDDGSLQGGINIWGDGTGYYQWPGGDDQDTDDWGTLALINTIEATGRKIVDLNYIYPNEEGIIPSDFYGRFGVLDMSLQ